MTIRIKLIPDGLVEVPPEARDDGVQELYLSGVDNIPASSEDPIDSWRDIERRVTGSGTHIELRVPGSLDDYDSVTLETIRDSIVSNVSGLKAHPNGWE